jgi:TPR repeat protein
MILHLTLSFLLLLSSSASANLNTLITDAETGMVEAQIELADTYFYKTDTQKGRALSLKWYIQALHQTGNIKILERVLFLKTIVYSHDETLVKNKYSRLIHPKNEDSEELLYVAAIVHLNGFGVSIDLTKSKDLLKKSASKGYSHAQFFLARTYNNDTFHYTDKAMYYYWLTQASKNNHPEATYQLATLYLNSNSLVGKNKPKAISLLKKSTLLGNYQAKLLYNTLTRNRT